MSNIDIINFDLSMLPFEVEPSAEAFDAVAVELEKTQDQQLEQLKEIIKKLKNDIDSTPDDTTSANFSGSKSRREER